ncbi:putative reverse transcriptase domain-containing protein [Tanacetum coccineum]|uniref:Reverse transcriptase domain-containing protein n=1 Tax=Tanacetum coccineum TaxID=301880 RepID=A0ABQ4Z9R9_9ASTR
MGKNQRVCYECGSLDHLRNDCPKWKKQLDKQEPVSIWRETNTLNNGNQARGRAFNRMHMSPLLIQSVTVTFSLTINLLTVLFDSRADFSFISTKFAPLLNVEPCIVNPSYVIEIADGESVEVNRNYQ